MILKSAPIILLSVVVAGCGGAGEKTDEGSNSRSAVTQQAMPDRVNADDGSIDIVVSGETVEQNSRGDANSVQCQLSFTVANRGVSEIKSLMVNYDLLNRVTAEAVKSGLQMVIATKIGVGQSAAPWGTETVDDVRCSDLSLRFPEQPAYQCKTTTSATCTAFTYAGSNGVTVEREGPGDS